jgi:hypothetical protein
MAEPASRASAVDEAVERYRVLLESADASERALLMGAVETTAADTAPSPELDRMLWGPAPTPTAQAATALALLRVSFQQRRELAANSVSRTAAAALLSISPQAATEHLRHGDLLGCKDGARWLLPAWQFDANCPRDFLPGIAAVAAAFGSGPVALSQWVNRPSPDLGGLPPHALMARGEVDRVVDVAATLTAVGW